MCRPEGNEVTHDGCRCRRRTNNVLLEVEKGVRTERVFRGKHFVCRIVTKHDRDLLRSVDSSVAVQIPLRRIDKGSSKVTHTEGVKMTIAIV